MLNKLIRLTGQNTIFPFYHTVSDVASAHIKHLYQSKKILDFEKDLDFLLSHYRPMDLADVISYINNGKKTEKPGFFLTFDDGLSEVYNHICPMLYRKGIPAAVFFNSAFVDNKGLFYRYKASILIEKLSESPHLVKNNAVVRWAGGKNKISDIKNTILNIRYAGTAELDSLAEILHVSFNDYLQKTKPYMTLDQISSIVQQGFYAGGHSIDHPEYYNISQVEQLRQTNESIQYITDRHLSSEKLFAFPFSDTGVQSTFFTSAKIDLSFGTAGLKNDPIRHHLQRIPMEKGELSAKKLIINQYLYYILKSFFDKNTIRR